MAVEPGPTGEVMRHRQGSSSSEPFFAFAAAVLAVNGCQILATHQSTSETGPPRMALELIWDLRLLFII
jgi:hypothetical protein